MNKYIIRYFNDLGKFWSIYHITNDMSDAYKVHKALVQEGYQASITSEYEANP